MPFLEIITRTFGGRPSMLQRCQASLARLNEGDWSQQMIVDSVGRGVPWANKNLGMVDVTGDWVWVLDDDDVCSHDNLIGELREIIAEQHPDVIMVRVLHKEFKMLPPDELWEKRPVMGRYGGACAIVRREVWNQFRIHWPEEYAGDFVFVDALWEAGLRFAWLPVIAAYMPQQSLGAEERADAR